MYVHVCLHAHTLVIITSENDSVPECSLLSYMIPNAFFYLLWRHISFGFICCLPLPFSDTIKHFLGARFLGTLEHVYESRFSRETEQ